MEDMRPFGLWSDGETLWVADEEERTLFAYAVPGLLKPSSLTGRGLGLTLQSRAVSAPGSDPGPAESVADAALRGHVEAVLGQTPGAVIGAHELAALASLTRLEELDRGGNRITDFAPLDGRAGLKVLGRKTPTLE